MIVLWARKWNRLRNMKYNSSIYNLKIQENDQNVFVFNTYTGALVELEKKLYKTISTTLLDDEEKCDSFDMLLKEGLIKPLQLNEFNRLLLKEQISILSDNDESLTFVIVPTTNCNLRCTYCFQNQLQKNMHMSKEDMYSIINFIESRINSFTKKVHITWFGGEPLIAFDLIVMFSSLMDELIVRKKIKYSASMITNGTLLDLNKIDILIKKCYLSNFQITIDGTEENYCNIKKASPKQFHNLFVSLKYLIKYARVSVRLNCDKNNYDDLKIVAKHIIDFCGINSNLRIYLAKIIDYTCMGNVNNYKQSEFDLKLFEFNKYLAELLNKENFKIKLPKYRKQFCGLVKINNLVIGPNCELYKCEHDIGHQERIIGHIKQGIYCSDYLLDFLKNSPKVECKKCKLFPICLGGCPSHKKNLPKGEGCLFTEKYIIDIVKLYINDGVK